MTSAVIVVSQTIRLRTVVNGIMLVYTRSKYRVHSLLELSTTSTAASASRREPEFGDSLDEGVSLAGEPFQVLGVLEVIPDVLHHPCCRCRV